MTSKEWDLLQTLHVHTLLYTQVITGAGDRWKNAVMDICWDVESLGELLHNLEFLERTVAPNTNATCLIMPSIHEARSFAASRCESLRTNGDVQSWGRHLHT